MNAETYLLALEGGGTRSQAALLHRDGHVLQVKDSGEVNTNFTSYDQARASVRRAVEQVLAAAQVPGERVGCFVSSLIGPDFAAETFGDLCPNARYSQYSERDVVFARAGIYQPHGVAVVAATGATAFSVRADDGRHATVGGWGALLGDEGSAYHLGLLGLRAAVLSFEGREETPTRLVEALCQRLGIQRAAFQHELVTLAYGKPLSRAEIAALAELVTGLAAQGDALALRLTEQVFADLAALMLHAARRLFQPEETFDVVVAGGMVNAGELLLGALRGPLGAAYPRAVLQPGLQPPAVALGRLKHYHLSQQEQSC